MGGMAEYSWIGWQATSINEINKRTPANGNGCAIFIFKSFYVLMSGKMIVSYFG